MTEPTPPPTSPPPVPDEPRPRTAWRRLALAASPRATRAQALGAVLALALGFAIVTQVQATQAGGLEQMRQDDLVQVLDDVTQRSARLDQQVRDLQTQRDRLAAGGGGEEAAAQAQARLDALRLLAGTAPATGPGVRITVSDPSRKVESAQLLDLVEELRDAGAEVQQVGSVRVVASTWFADQDGGLVVDGTPVPRPVTVRAIGDPQTLASAMTIPGGVVETLRRLGADATVTQVPSLTVDALASPRTPRYAQPVPQSGGTPTP